MNYQQYDLCVVGLGPAGLASMIIAGQKTYTCIGVEVQLFPGGQCTALYPAKHMKNILGFAGTAQEFVDNLMYQARQFKTNTFVFGHKVISTHKGKLMLDNGNEIYAHKIIIATGSGPIKIRTLDYQADNLYYSQINIHHKQAVAVLGGGDAALEAALKLAENDNQVYLIHRRHQFRAELNVIEAVQNNNNIEIIITDNLNTEFQNSRIIKIAGNIIDHVYAYYGLMSDQYDKLYDEDALYIGDAGGAGKDISEFIGDVYKMFPLK